MPQLGIKPMSVTLLGVEDTKREISKELLGTDAAGPGLIPAKDFVEHLSFSSNFFLFQLLRHSLAFGFSISVFNVQLAESTVNPSFLLLLFHLSVNCTTW